MTEGVVDKSIAAALIESFSATIKKTSTSARWSNWRDILSSNAKKICEMSCFSTSGVKIEYIHPSYKSSKCLE